MSKTPRSRTTRDLFNATPGRLVAISHELLAASIGNAERAGIWLIYGLEKNGKTWFTLQLAKALCASEKVDYISAEEGLKESFKTAVRRAGITTAHKIGWNEYLSLPEIVAKYRKPKAAKVLVLDNATMYADEFKTKGVLELSRQLPGTLIILVAHEERKQPYPSCARFAQKMAPVFIRINGFKASVTSRYAGNSELPVNEDAAEMYWGSEPIEPPPKTRKKAANTADQ